MHTSRIVAVVLTCLLGLVFCHRPAQAQYWLEVEPGYTLEAVEPAAGSLAAAPDPIIQRASETTGMQIEAVFTVQPGKLRYYNNEWDEPSDEWRYKEYSMVPKHEAAGPGAEPLQYLIDGRPVLIGLGFDPGEMPEWPVYAAASLAQQADGSLIELDRWQLGAQYSAGVYALDLLNDGSICLVLPWATGAGAGGGVDVLQLTPEGKFKFFGEDREQAMIWSTHGYVELVDCDNDGAWELVTGFPLLFTAAGYTYKDLLVFDRASWSWISGAERFPEFYEPQDRFYHALIATVRDMRSDPAKYRNDDPHVEGLYGFTWEGAWYSLEPFVNYDTGEFDPTWLEDLERMFPEE